MKRSDVIIGNFLGGLAWGIGSVLGAAIVVTGIGWTLNSVGALDPVKEFFQQIQALPQVPKLYR